MKRSGPYSTLIRNRRFFGGSGIPNLDWLRRIWVGRIVGVLPLTSRRGYTPVSYFETGERENPGVHRELPTTYIPCPPPPCRITQLRPWEKARNPVLIAEPPTCASHLPN